MKNKEKIKKTDIDHQGPRPISNDIASLPTRLIFNFTKPFCCRTKNTVDFQNFPQSVPPIDSECTLYRASYFSIACTAFNPISVVCIFYFHIACPGDSITPVLHTYHCEYFPVYDVEFIQYFAFSTYAQYFSPKSLIFSDIEYYLRSHTS